DYTEELYWSIRSKEFHWFCFKLDKGAKDLENLDSGIIGRSIRAGMADHGLSLSGNCEIRRPESLDNSDNKEETLQQWIISDLDTHHSFMLYPLIEKPGPDPQEEAHVMEIHHWAPSERITYGRFYDRHPSATTINNQTLIFWDRFIEQAGDFPQRWCICFVVRNEKLRTRIYEFALDEESNSGRVERKSPFALTNPSGDLCLFWLERKNNGPWKLVFKQFHITAGEPDEIANSITPEDPKHMPVFDSTRIEYDIFVIFEKTENKRFKVWLFWAQYETVVPGEDSQPSADGAPNGQWHIYYCITKNEGASIPEARSEWENPKPIRDYTGELGGDREPAAVCIEGSATERIELYWRSRGCGNPRIWKSVYSPQLNEFKRPVLVTGGSESDFAPLPILLNGKRFLIYRSTRSIKHTSRLYSATQTCDTSPSGSVTVDTANSAAMALMGHFGDFHTYTYDTGCSFKDGAFTPRSEKSRYARDTIGIYLSPESDEVGDYRTNCFILSQVLRKFLPIQVRPVFFVEPKPDIESVYEEGEEIGEHYTDSYFTREIYDQVHSKHRDYVPEWKVFHSQIRKEGKLPYKNHKTVDTKIEHVDLSYRTAHTGIDMGEDK
ncbi:MAG: hypothetical protein ACFFCW_34800, partial [Candidatus Hodarchaeota archaeon]